MKKELRPALIFGATGSVGSSALDVCEEQGIPVYAIGAGGKSIKKAEEVIRRFSVQACVVAEKEQAEKLRRRVKDTPCKIYTGEESYEELISSYGKHITVFNAVSGAAGLPISFAAAKAGVNLALANKESMIIAGELLKKEAAKSGCVIIPVDSEHCAISECLNNGKKEEVRRIIITASGGPFFGKTKDEIYGLGKEAALAHPTWKMGPKISVDSASLCNKGFEVIEAARLFDVSPDEIDVVIHRESIIHSLVEFKDMSTFAVLSNPDMRLPSSHALTYPDRAGTSLIKPLDLPGLAKLTFYEPDRKTFPLLDLALYAVAKGGVIPAVMIAADEVAVAAFLRDKISFGEISDLVCKVVREYDPRSLAQKLSDFRIADENARRITENYID